MEIVNIEILQDFARKNSGLRNISDSWISIVKDSNWGRRQDVFDSFPRVDYNFRHKAYIFNLGGNFRLIARISFSAGYVSVLDILNHDDCMKWSNRG